ncbi:MAG: 30S ribosomal protein S6 [Planctomyces sp.]|nr:30S ribosomal protein S6 [Planctomyces sp.]
MRHYELVVILSPMLNTEQASDTWGRIKGFISNRDAEIFHEETWGTRRLAYSIRKGAHHFLEGTYHLTRFSTETPFNKELETFLRLDEQVLRSMVVVGDPPKPVSETVAVAAPPVVEEIETPEEPAVVAEETVEDAPAVAEETPEEATAVVEEVVEDAPAEAEEVPEEAANEVEEVIEDTPAVAEETPEETPEEATNEVEDAVEESPAETDETPEDEPTNT